MLQSDELDLSHYVKSLQATLGQELLEKSEEIRLLKAVEGELKSNIAELDNVQLQLKVCLLKSHFVH